MAMCTFCIEHSSGLPMKAIGDVFTLTITPVMSAYQSNNHRLRLVLYSDLKDLKWLSSLHECGDSFVVHVCGSTFSLIRSSSDEKNSPWSRV